MFVEFFTFFFLFTEHLFYLSIMGFTKFLLKNSGTESSVCISVCNYNYYYRLSPMDFTVSHGSYRRGYDHG